MRPPDIALVDDHALVRQGLADLLADRLGANIVFSGPSMDGLGVVQPPPDLLILDLDLGGTTASDEFAGYLIQSGIPILVVSALGSPKAIRAMIRAGVAGFVSKAESPEVLVEAVTAVLADGCWTSSEVAAAIAGDPARPPLSVQEERVLVLYTAGLKVDSVGRRVGISGETVKTYLKRIRRKYAEHGRAAYTRTDLYREAVRDGLVESDVV